MKRAQCFLRENGKVTMYSDILSPFHATDYELLCHWDSMLVEEDDGSLTSHVVGEDDNVLYWKCLTIGRNFLGLKFIEDGPAINNLED